jgi:hypothetical protein
VSQGDVHRRQQVRHGGGICGIHLGSIHFPRDRTVEGSGIHVTIAETNGQQLRHRAFPDTGRTVNRNNQEAPRGARTAAYYRLRADSVNNSKRFALNPGKDVSMQSVSLIWIAESVTKPAIANDIATR